MSDSMPNDRIPNDRESQSDWDACPQGELSQMVRGLDAAQSRARNRKLYKIGTLSMLLVACGIVVGGSFVEQNGLQGGGITCTECGSHFAEYHGHITGEGQLNDLTLASSMAAHLAGCSHCRSRFNKDYPGVLESSAPDLLHGGSQRLLAVSYQPTLY